MAKCQEILGIAQKFGDHWLAGPEKNVFEPRYLSVMDVLRRFGNEKNIELENALYGFIKLQHKHFTLYFQTLLAPIESTDPQPAPEPPPVPEVPPAQGIPGLPEMEKPFHL